MTALGEASRLAVSADASALRDIASAHALAIADARGGALFMLAEIAEQAEFDQWLLDHLADPTALVVTGTYNDVPLGYCVATTSELPDGQKLATIEALLVDPDARQVGIGEALMNDVVTWARSNGCASIDANALPGDRSTKNFFESFGLKARLLTVNIDLRD